MSVTKNDIGYWLKHAPKNTTHMIVVVDTFDYEDYPVYVDKSEDVRTVIKDNDDVNMQKVMEVYNLSMDITQQLNEGKTYNL